MEWLHKACNDYVVVIFEDPSEKINANDIIMVKGYVKVYKGELEIIADEIYCVRCIE